MTISDDSHDDLPSEHEADVSAQDADALDARLNEIAHSTGRATAWSRFGLNRRFRMRDAANVPGFAQAFHQRVEATEAADDGFSGLDPTLWEQIMASTHGAVTTPPTSAPSTTKPASGRKRSAARPGVSHPFWSGFANATLAVVVLLAAFGVWRVYDQRQGPPSPPSNETHSLAFLPEASATPETVPVGVDEVEQPESIFACDLSHDIPIFPKVDESPMRGTALLVTTTGDLVLTCPDEPEPVVLLSGVEQAAHTSWPGVVYTNSPYAQGEMPDVTYVSLITGESVGIGKWGNGSVQGQREFVSSPWLVHPSDDDSGRWAITDFRTMESHLLDDVSGVTWPAASADSISLNINISFSEDSGVLAVWPGHPYTDVDPAEDVSWAVDAEAIAEGDALIINNSLDDVHWIDLPADLPPVRDMRLSPDGTHLALIGSGSIWDAQPVRAVSIVDVATGEEVARSEEGVYRGNFELSATWVQDGHALAYLQNEALNLLTLDGESRVLLTVDGEVVNLRNTVDPDVVNVSRMQAEEVATETPDQVRALTYVVNTRTADVVEVEGSDLRNTWGWEQPASVVMLIGTVDVAAETTTYRLVDAVTGEDIAGLDELVAQNGQYGQPEGGKNSFTSSMDGSATAVGIGDGPLWVIQETEGIIEAREVAAPIAWGMGPFNFASVLLSPNGTMLSLTVNGDESRTRYLLDLTDIDAGWAEIPSTVPGSGPDMVRFIPGLGD